MECCCRILCCLESLTCPSWRSYKCCVKGAASSRAAFCRKMTDVQFEIVVAILDRNRGYALGNRLPWPYLKGDHDFYMTYTTTRRDPSKKNVFIMGRSTWECWRDDEKCNPHLLTVVTSNTMQSDGIPKVCSSFEDAITYVTSAPIRDQVENIFIMGGGQNYRLCIDDPRLVRMYITRVFADFEADAFFPKFEDKFRKVSCPRLDESLQEDNGVKYQFELWERKQNETIVSPC